jgi:trimethylamine---corrinoid protein Co-methyltransferase
VQTTRFEVLSPDELERIHRASMILLETTGIKVDYAKARDLFRSAGAEVDDETQRVRLPEKLVQWAVSQAPHSFDLYGRDGLFKVKVGDGHRQFAGLGTPTRIIDPQTHTVRPTLLEDLVRHLILIDGCENIHCTQMDIWANDISMTTIHTEAIYAWARHSHKSFGMGCYGYLPTLDMMQMMALAVGGKQELQQKPRFFGICSVMSPLQMAQMQLEGMLICVEYGQPVAMSPEAIAGATAPVTLAGLLVQENANILAHITLAQIFRPGAPVLYGTVSTIANMRHGTVALGSVETGLITAASAQLARYYGLPCRSVGAATESKLEDIQAGIERTATLLPAVLAGVDYITCAGTLDSSMLESDALFVLDDEVCGMLTRMARGIEVTEDSLALDLIQKIGSDGNYLAEEHTVQNYKREHYMPRLMLRDPYDIWVENGSPSALEKARQRVQTLVGKHQPYPLEAALENELDIFCKKVAGRSIEDFYNGELAENQDWSSI